MSLAFAKEHKALQELYETYLKRAHTPLARLGYYINDQLGSKPEFVIEKKIPSV
jgi:hypothetical protein